MPSLSNYPQRLCCQYSTLDTAVYGYLPATLWLMARVGGCGIISINITAAVAAGHNDNVRRFRSNERLLSAHNEVAGRGKVERPL